MHCLIVGDFLYGTVESERCFCTFLVCPRHYLFPLHILIDGGAMTDLDTKPQPLRIESNQKVYEATLPCLYWKSRLTNLDAE